MSLYIGACNQEHVTHSIGAVGSLIRKLKFVLILPISHSIYNNVIILSVQVPIDNLQESYAL